MRKIIGVEVSPVPVATLGPIVPTCCCIPDSCQLRLGLDGRILLEVPLLVQRIGLLGGLQQPGMKQVEAWAVAKSLDIQPGGEG